MNSKTRGFNFFFFNDTATTEIYTLSLHDALPILAGAQGHTSTALSPRDSRMAVASVTVLRESRWLDRVRDRRWGRSEEHTSELQSQSNLVCRLLLEKKKKKFEAMSSAKTKRPHTL